MKRFAATDMASSAIWLAASCRQISPPCSITTWSSRVARNAPAAPAGLRSSCSTQHGLRPKAQRAAMTGGGSAELVACAAAL
eukprot:380649-Hanusia_phi.AAC.2